MATVQDIINKAYTKVNGEFEAVPAASDDFNTYLNVLNQVMTQWAQTPYVKWQSLFNADYKLPAPVTAGQLIYPVADADTIHIGNTPFDGVYFVDDDDVVIAKYKMTDQAFYDASPQTTICMLASDGLHLKAVTDDMIGASIKLPAYVDPPTYSDPTTVVRIDSVPWLVASMAAFICDSSPVPFIARNADKFDKEAQIYMKTMRADNRRAQHLIIKGMTSAQNDVGIDEMIDIVTIDGVFNGGNGGGSGTIIFDGGSA